MKLNKLFYYDQYSTSLNKKIISYKKEILLKIEKDRIFNELFSNIKINTSFITYEFGENILNYCINFLNNEKTEKEIFYIYIKYLMKKKCNLNQIVKYRKETK